MTKADKIKEYEALLKSFDDGHRKLKQMKRKMVALRIEIGSMQNIIDIRPDELNLKNEDKS